MTVYIVQRPRPRIDRVTGAFMGDLDLSSAGHYGKIEFVFETEDRPSVMPGPMLDKARGVLKDFNDEDFLLWAGGDPVAFMIATGVAAQTNGGRIPFLVWERERLPYGAPRPPVRGGSYLPRDVKVW
jgi:hypothetical protein